METTTSFTILVNSLQYSVKPYYENEYEFYEIFTNCEKLFTIKRNEYGNWQTKEEDVIPITESLVENIGNAVDEAEMKL